MNQEFLRMQKLAGVKPAQEDHDDIVNILTEAYLYTHYYSKGILKENINKVVLEGIIDRIKKKFSDLSSKAKQATKKVVDAVKTTGFNPAEIIGDLSKINKKDLGGTKILDTIRAIQTLNLAKKLQEAEGDNKAQEFTDINQLKDLKPGDIFVWKGETDPNAKWNGEDITINAAKSQYGLKSNTRYIVQPAEDWEGGRGPQISSTNEVEYLAKTGGFGPKLMRFFRYIGNKLGGKQALGILTALITLSGVAGATFGDEGEYGSASLAQKTNPTALDKDAGEITQAADALASNDNEIDQEIPTSGTPYNTEIDDSEVVRGLDDNNVDTQGLEVTDNTATTQTYETGEGKLDEAGVEKSSNELAEKTIDDLNDQLKANKGKNLTKISLKIKYGAAVSHNQGDDSNVANGGGDLLDQRLDSSEKVAKLAAQKVQDAVEKTYGSDIDVSITYEKIDNHSSIDDQKIQTAEDFIATQSSFQSSESDIDTSEKEGEPIKLLYFQFLAEPDNLGPSSPDKKNKEQSKKEEPKPTNNKVTVTPPPPVSTDSEMERDVKAIANLNRQSQIAFLLAKTNPGEDQDNPGLNLFKALGLSTSTNITDGELNSIADQGIYKGKEVSMEAEDLAKVIRASRKNPNAIINAYAKLTGTKAKETRARASITQKGVTGKSASAPIKEGFSNLAQLLAEATIDTLLSGIQALPTQQAAFLAKLVNIMYVGTGGGSVLDPESNEDENFKVEYDKIQSPLASKEKGERYVYLDKKQDQIKNQPDIDRVDKIISNNTPLMTVIKRINTQDELASLLTALFIYRDKNGEDLFPQGKQFKDDPSKVRSALFGLNYRLNEEDINELPFDVKDFISRLEKTTGLLQALNRVNNLEEFHQLILRVILPKVNPSLLKDKAKLKAAIAKAANASKQFADKGKYTV